MLSDEDKALIYETVQGAKTILEIGSRAGNSSMILAAEAKKNLGMLYCVECEPIPLWYENMRKCNLENFATMIQTFSPWVDYTKLPTSLDYLFIDGDHRTSHFIADFHFFSPLVRKGGFVAIHDTNFAEENIKFMVNRGIKIVLEDHPHFKRYKECKGRFGTIVLRKEEEKMW